MKFRAMQKTDLVALKEFTDKAIGEGYYSLMDLEDVWQKSFLNKHPDVICSFVLVDNNDKILGCRLAYAPGSWQKGKGHHLRPDLWGVPQDQVGYFQSLFLDESIRGDGWGPRMSEAAIQAMTRLGATAVVTHAWKESPDNSSVRYLTKFGFKKVIEHPDYWVNVNYKCTRDGYPCRCTAVEMIKRIS